LESKANNLIKSSINEYRGKVIEVKAPVIALLIVGSFVPVNVSKTSVWFQMAVEHCSL